MDYVVPKFLIYDCWHYLVMHILLCYLIRAKKMKLTSYNLLGGTLLCVFGLFSTLVSAGGISLGGTRVVYPLDAKQTSVSIRNTDDSAIYLVQSWIEKQDGTRTQDFIVTPPLYTSRPGNENTLRLISVDASLPQNKESLYYFNVKAVPSVDKKTREAGNSSLVVATVIRVKMFVRPDGLQPVRDKALQALQFIRKGAQLEIRNPTPYYLTISQLKAGNHELQNVMVAPKSHESVPLPAGSGNNLSWRTINDYGGEDKGEGSIQ
ncbi:fimbria/pilus periplasmic chaperone [Pectobacterium parmentieri]|nr:fimbria/pilus periplasmic chaperone [Pectobacterium parmentieri]